MEKSKKRHCDSSPFEWNQNVLYVVGKDFDGETAWIDRDVAEDIRNHAPTKLKDPALMYLINREDDKEDELYFVSEMVVVSGGEIMCFIGRMAHH